MEFRGWNLAAPHDHWPGEEVALEIVVTRLASPFELFMRLHLLGECLQASCPARANQHLLFGPRQTCNLDLDQVRYSQQTLAARAEHKIVQGYLIALLAQLVACFDDFGVRLDIFEQLDDGVLRRQRLVPTSQQWPSAEIYESFLDADQVFQPDHQQTVGQHDFRSETGFGAVELVVSGVRAEE